MEKVDKDIPLQKEIEMMKDEMVKIKGSHVPPGVNRKKNAKDSTEYRQKGNELFNSQTHNWEKHEQILDYYSRSVALAPNNSEELAFAYGNRSALLLHLEKYAECIKDCDLALDTTVNDNLEAKLLCRKAECLAALKDSSATEVIKNTLLVLEKLTTLDDEAKKQYIEKLNVILNNLSILTDENEKLENEDQDENQDNRNEDEEQEGEYKIEGPYGEFSELLAAFDENDFPENIAESRKMYLNQSNAFMREVKKLKETKIKVAVEPRPEIANVELPTFDRQKEAPCASDAITIAYNKQWGRHLVATRDIDPGEILVVEESCYHFVFPNGMYVLCSHCAKYAWSSIPCKHCIFGVYCSESCRAEAWDKYHKFECEVFGAVWDIGEELTSNTSSIRLLLKVTHEAGGIDNLREYLIELYQNKDLRTRCFTAKGTFPDKKCISLLTVNLNIDEYDDELQYSYVRTARAALYLIATKSTFFGKKLDIQSMDPHTWNDFIFIGAVLTRCFMLMPRICFPLEEYHFEDLQFLDYGFIAHPLCTLMNHSCDPNVLYIKTYNNEAIVFAKYPIKKGEQLFVSYTPSFLVTPKDMRQKVLAEVHKFTCTCIACEKDWSYGDNTLPLSISIIKKNPQIREELSKGLDHKDVLKVLQHIINNNYTYDPELIAILSKMQKGYAEKITIHCSDYQGYTYHLYQVYRRAFGSFNTMPDKCSRNSG